MPARLIPLNPGLARPIALERPVLLIGRHLECDAQLPHPRVSRRHCCVAQVGQRLVLRDLGSRSGVRINGYRIDEAALEEGDEVAIGPLIFRLEGLRPEPPASAVSPGDSSSSLEDSDLVPFDD